MPLVRRDCRTNDSRLQLRQLHCPSCPPHLPQAAYIKQPNTTLAQLRRILYDQYEASAPAGSWAVALRRLEVSAASAVGKVVRPAARFSRASPCLQHDHGPSTFVARLARCRSL